MKKIRFSGKKGEKSGIKSLIFGVCISFFVIFLISFAAALILSGNKSAASLSGKITLPVLLISAGLSGFITSKYKGDGGIVTSLISSLVFVGICAAVALISKKGIIGGKLFMNYICYIPVSILFAYFGKKRVRRHKRRGHFSQ